MVLKFLDQHKTAIAHLFNKMKCNPASIIGKLGCSAQVTDDNVTQFIGRWTLLDNPTLSQPVENAKALKITKILMDSKEKFTHKIFKLSPFYYAISK